MSRVLGLFGGTFDPVHYGHLRAASEVRAALEIGDMRLVPAGDPPHRDPPGAGAAHRLAMLELAVAEFPDLSIDTRELVRGGKSYTVLTLRELREEMPARPLALVVGADAFAGLPQWHRWRELFELAHLVVVTRPGAALEGRLAPSLAALWKSRRSSDHRALETRQAGAIFPLAVTPQPISATAIRESFAAGADAAALRGLLPAAVLAYIDQHHLYRRR